MAEMAGTPTALTPTGFVNATSSSIFVATVKEALSTSFPSTAAASPSSSSGTLTFSDLPEGVEGVMDPVNGTKEGEGDDSHHHDFSMTISMTVIYILITITGVLGNVATCVVIVRNRIMHTATNYYLFSMAISDLLLLALGMPDEMYLLWWGRPYVFGAEFCFIRGFTAEISTNASILTIAAFTVERYIGICHPLRSHTMSQLGRVIRSIAVIWIVATGCAVPIAIQYGIVYEQTPSGKDDPSTAACLIKKRISWVFEISTVLFFVAPMLLISILYVCIAIQLKRSTKLARSVPSIASHNCSSTNDGSRNKAVIKMLVAVVIAFFVCFAPHQAQRLMAIHADPSNEVTVKLFTVLHNIAGISYYISTCVNPILYHIMSNRFRQALQVTLESCCGGKSGAGGGLHESDAMFMDSYKNGTSGYFHHHSQSMKHRRSLSVHQPTTLAAQRLRHTNSLNARQVNSVQSPSGSCSSYKREYRPLLHHQSTSSTGLQAENSLKSNGTSHTWV